MEGQVIKKAVEEGHIISFNDLEADSSKSSAFFYDLDAYESNLDELKAAFPPHFLHAAAIKANPVTWFVRNLNKHELGAECASLGEVIQALNCGIPKEKIVFDSPCKTVSELKFALENGIHINLDNLQEVDRVSKLLKTEEIELKSNIGLRINPLLGKGALEALSVSTAKSKFGCPCTLEATSEQDRKLLDDLVKACSNNDFINCIHVHSGSGGMGVEKLVSGAKTAISFAKIVNEMRKLLCLGGRKITIIDIGGGISVNFEKSKNDNTYAEYAEKLEQQCPELFDPNIFQQVITEFGASMNATFGFFASRVEYTKSFKEYNTVIIHGGSDVFLRACYSPAQFAKHNISLIKDHTYEEAIADNLEDKAMYQIGGPLCFAGDVVSSQVNLKKDCVLPGDFLVIHDAGANTVALKNMHCSRPLPGIYGFRNGSKRDVQGSGISLEVLKQPQSISELLAFW